MSRLLGSAWLAFSVATTIPFAVAPVLAESRIFDLAIHGSSLPPEQRVIRVQQGDAVTLRWTSDRALTLHLHGYDVEQRVTPGTTATMSFTAKATGRFPVEIHGGDGHGASALAYLEVHPR
jgi:hypothetical protein